ncbi:uncharacterized protein LOC104584737 isoform X2 [Brachypodium distachyon]|uniref:uncharacterized protein LOC104584737 isoform X2 n=1 Tax=Brachypodium distachyon TaxID=15368 RepID=UPI00071E162B|nr:uncharacterized protein LOC104584737 isoform X2 [Brachypodium distachyon]|eukprot:XP_014754176.1 uncharacterized protein LOC104584737 isoform X2 [Brachypodium distachyon]
MAIVSFVHSEKLYRSPEYHQLVRKERVNQIWWMGRPCHIQAAADKPLKAWAYPMCSCLFAKDVTRESSVEPRDEAVKTGWLYWSSPGPAWTPLLTAPLKHDIRAQSGHGYTAYV